MLQLLVLELSKFDRPKARNLPFPFPSFSFSSIFSLRTVSPFVPHFLSFLSFLLFYSFLFSHLIFSSFSPFLWSFSLPFWSNHSFGQKEEISSPFPQTKGVAINFPSLFPYFLNPLYDIITTWLNVSHGIHFPHMVNCEPFSQCQVSLSYGAMWHPQPCHVSSDTPRLEKREIPTSSESNEIRRGS